ncbi:hypothetical protein EVA_11301 [gut metagenome]|uniref:Uncharacterized protein n=1 Tax=gut metagenome TaxID=749906 RepID=J9GLH8_9ZZZZ
MSPSLSTVFPSPTIRASISLICFLKSDVSIYASKEIAPLLLFIIYLFIKDIK